MSPAYLKQWSFLYHEKVEGMVLETAVAHVRSSVLVRLSHQAGRRLLILGFYSQS